MNILITGGSSGLGRCITETAAAAFPEAKIYFSYNSSGESALEIEKGFSNTESLKLDFKDSASVAAVSEKIAEWDIDVLINNALPSFIKNHFHKNEAGVFIQSFSDNISPVLTLTSAFIKSARSRKRGRIITILSSFVGGMPRLGLSEYTANKHYLLSMIKSWAAENVQFNIQSNAVSPEFMDTALNKDLDVRLKEEMIKSHPLKKLLTPEDAARVVRFLIDAPAHLNGQNIFLDTGKN